MTYSVCTAGTVCLLYSSPFGERSCELSESWIVRLVEPLGQEHRKKFSVEISAQPIRGDSQSNRYRANMIYWVPFCKLVINFQISTDLKAFNSFNYATRRSGRDEWPALE